jgi:hypothetical protein
MRVVLGVLHFRFVGVCGSVLRWHIVVAQCVGACCSSMARRVGALCWRIVLAHCVGALCWRIVLAHCVGALCWRIVLAHCVGALCWRVVSVRCVSTLC